MLKGVTNLLVKFISLPADNSVSVSIGIVIIKLDKSNWYDIKEYPYKDIFEQKIKKSKY